MRKRALTLCVPLPTTRRAETAAPGFRRSSRGPDPIPSAWEGALKNEARRRMLEERFSAMHESLIADTPALASDVIMSVARS